MLSALTSVPGRSPTRDSSQPLSQARPALGTGSASSAPDFPTVCMAVSLRKPFEEQPGLDDGRRGDGQSTGAAKAVEPRRRGPPRPDHVIPGHRLKSCTSESQFLKSRKLQRVRCKSESSQLLDIGSSYGAFQLRQLLRSSRTRLTAYHSSTSGAHGRSDGSGETSPEPSQVSALAAAKDSWATWRTCSAHCALQENPAASSGASGRVQVWFGDVEPEPVRGHAQAHHRTPPGSNSKPWFR